MPWDLVVVGGGISGLALAWAAARAGRRVVLLEKNRRLGGCIHSHRIDDLWFEMGAHTVYNSYGGFLDLAIDCRAVDKLVQRGPARVHFGLLRDGRYTWLTPPRVLGQLNWLQAALRFPVGVFRRKRGKTIESYYSKLLGKKNFRTVLSPFFAAVPSQNADGFPAIGPGSLFKKRPRRKEFPRSYGFEGGLQMVCEAVAGTTDLTVEREAEVTRMTHRPDGFRVTTGDHREFRAPQLALALPASVAAELLTDEFEDLAEILRRIDSVEVESLGVVLPKEKCWMPECAFVVPVKDCFFSMVTRDPFPDAHRRAFCFHFRSGLSRDVKLGRMRDVLKLAQADLGTITESRVSLPAPALGHHRIVDQIDATLAGKPLALTGNYFAGLAIEDCVQRSLAEFRRLAS